MERVGKNAYLFLLFTFLSTACGLSFGNQAKNLNLDNGLRICLLEDHTLPLVSLQIWFKRNLKTEEAADIPYSLVMSRLYDSVSPPGTTRSFVRTVSDLGGRYTSSVIEDAFVFKETFPSHLTEKILSYEAHRLKNPFPGEASSAPPTVNSKKGLSVPFSDVLRAFLLVKRGLFASHPYSLSPYQESNSDIPSFDRKNLVKSMARVFNPYNAILILVGDFETAVISKKIKKLFKKIPKSTYKEVPLPDPLPIKDRDLFLETEKPLCLVLLGFRLPRLTLQEKAALDLSAEFLTERMNVVSEGRPINRGHGTRKAETDFYLSGGLFTILSIDRINVHPKTAAKAIDEELFLLKRGELNEKAFNQAKKKLVMSNYFNNSGLEGVSSFLSMHHFYGSVPREENYRKVSIEQVVKVSREHLSRENMVRVMSTDRGAKKE